VQRIGFIDASRGQPMSATVTSPVNFFDSGLSKPIFGATKVTVRVARTHAPKGPAGIAIEAAGDVDGEDWTLVR